MNKNALTEALKEALRVILLSVIPLLILGVQDGFKFNYQMIGVVALIAFLKFVDKWLHERAPKDGWLKKQGLTGF